MFATHVIKNAEDETVGYLVDNVFYTDYSLKQNKEEEAASTSTNSRRGRSGAPESGKSRMKKREGKRGRNNEIRTVTKRHDGGNESA